MHRDIDITFTEEQGFLLDTAVSFASQKSTRQRVRDLVESPKGFDVDAWTEMASLGWTGLVSPEIYGGANLSIDNAVPIVEALGARLMATPLMGSLLASYAIVLSEAEAPKRQWLERLSSGAIGAIAFSEADNAFDWSHPTCTAVPAGEGYVLSGVKALVPFAADADVVIVNVQLAGASRLVSIAADAIARTNLLQVISTDATQRLYTVDLTGIEVGEADVWDADLGLIARAASLLIAAEMCGATSGVMELTLDYLRTRRQFGRPIGSYQALKHTMADIYTQHELLRSLVYAAASNFTSDAGEMLVRMAKAKADDLLLHASDRAVQFHGGFGFTYDCDAGFYLRRALWSRSQFGDARHHRKRLGRMLLDA
jgi:acyl-CoA dehydrogenase